MGKPKCSETNIFEKPKKFNDYAHIEVLVTFLLVNFFTKMNIARNPEGFQVPGVVQKNPTGLPELFKPTRDLNVEEKCEKLKFQNFEKIQKT